jgi:hypothetical protein
MDAKQELQNIRVQMASDFDFTALALKDMGLRFRTGMSETAKALQLISKRVDAIGREMEERFNQVEGRTRLQEQRFTRVLQVVESSLDDWKPEVEELRARLERLENKIDSAA